MVNGLADCRESPVAFFDNRLAARSPVAARPNQSGTGQKNAPATISSGDGGSVRSAFRLISLHQLHFTWRFAIMADNPKKPKGATGSPQAAAKPQPAGEQKQSGEPFKLERPSMSVQQVMLSKIFAKPEDNSYRGREDDPYSKDALKGFMESIKMQGGDSHTAAASSSPRWNLRSRGWPSPVLQPAAARRRRRGGLSRRTCWCRPTSSASIRTS